MVDVRRVEQWVAQMERLGEADIPMEIEGQIMTPRQYLQRVRGGNSSSK
ncbi:unnamed protein product [marine sediment metagenome]|uniref:Uncharacterized protein n=1 Tax=marine sediment metagenome TaxID=412755 RepID=X1CL94_9ZZZZ